MAQKAPDDMRPKEGHADRLSNNVAQIMKPALKVGGVTGLSGLFLGSFWGIARSSHPGIFALESGVYSFTLGTTFWASRTSILRVWGESKVTPGDKVLASGMAGFVGGCCFGLTRRFAFIRRDLFNAVLFSLFFAGGQKIYNIVDARQLQQQKARKPVSEKKSLFDSKWNPMQRFSNEQYVERLNKALLRIDAEIAIIDEDIEALRSQDAARKAGAKVAEGTSPQQSKE